MRTIVLLDLLKGIHTIKSIMDILNINKEGAIYYVHRLRKKGYVKTTYLRNKTRVYHISPEIRLGGTTYEEALNAHSPIKVATTTDYRIFGKKLMSEDVLIYTIQSQSVRKITAALALFRKISDWSYLYRLAKCHSLEREVGALYDVSRMIMRTRRMPKRFRNHALPKRYSRFSDIVPKLRSKHFRNIEETWKVHLPFNKQDLEAYT